MAKFDKALEDLRLLLSQVDRSEFENQQTVWERDKWVNPKVFRYAGKNPHFAKRSLDKLRRHSEFLMSHNQLTRALVRNVVLEAEGDDQRLLEAFVLVMAWGFPRIGYGPYRTSVMLESLAEQPMLLTRVVKALSEKSSQSTTDAYEDLLRIEQCGPAFATKFLYFASPDDYRVPIFDAVVARWLNSHGRAGAVDGLLRLNSQNRKHFGPFFDFCRKASSELGERDLGLIEYVMFVDQQARELENQFKELPKWIHTSFRIN